MILEEPLLAKQGNGSMILTAMWWIDFYSAHKGNQSEWPCPGILLKTMSL